MKNKNLYNSIASHGLPNTDVLDQLNNMIRSRSCDAFNEGSRIRKKIKDLSTLEKYQKEIRSHFMDAIGGMNYEKENLKIQWIDDIDKGTYHLIKLVFQSRLGHYVSAHLYKPKTSKAEKKAGILLACGHQLQGKDSQEYQFVAQILVNYDFVVLVIDPIGQGERFGYIDPVTHKVLAEPLTLEHDLVGYQTQLLGYSLAKPMIFDHIRGIDLLQSLSYVDPDRIGVTGNSGGGTMTSMLMMVDERIQAAAPATFITSRFGYQKTGQPQDREQHWKGLGIFGFDHEDILIAFAPKPLMVLAAQYDFFPIEGTLKSVAGARRMYDLYEKKENLQFNAYPIEHSYPPLMATDAAKFFSKIFYNHQSHIHKVELIYDEHSQVTPSNQVVLEYSDSKIIFDDNQELLSSLTEKRPTYQRTSWKEVTDFIEAKVMGNRIEAPLFAKRWQNQTTENYLFDRWTYNTQTDMHGAAFRFTPIKKVESSVLALWLNGTSSTDEHMSWIHQQINKGIEVIIVDLSGEGQLRQRDFIWWAKHDEWYGSLYKLNDDLLWLNDSLACLRIFETLKAVEFIQKLRPETKLSLYTEDEHVLYGAMANLLLDKPLTHKRKNGEFTYSNWVKRKTYPHLWGFTLSIPDLLKHIDLDEVLKYSDERTSYEN
jgi:hypothetical protein